jgi:AAA family ATP:ADP antiporter
VKSIVVCFWGAFFFLGMSYELVRSPSNVLFQSAYGVEHLALGLTLVPIAVVALFFIYTQLLDPLGPRGTLMATTLLSAGIMGVCYLGLQYHVMIVHGILLVFGQAYVVLLMEQYWSFVDSAFDESQARKLNPYFAGIGSVGSICGGLLVGFISTKFDTSTLFLLSTFCLLPAAALADYGYKAWLKTKKGDSSISLSKHKGIAANLGLPLFKSSPVLIWILLVVVMSQAVSTVLGLSFQTQLQNVFLSDVKGQTAYSGRFYATLNSSSMVAQFIVGPFLLRLLSPRVILFIIPLVHLATSATLFFSPSLQMASLAFMTFKCLDYSLFRATKELLYIPLSFDARYRAKELIDILGYRGSKGLTSGLVAVIQGSIRNLNSLYSLISLGAAALWFFCLIPIARTKKKTPAK